MEFVQSQPYTIGMELELQLLDAGSFDLRDAILPLLEAYPSSSQVKPEVVQNTLEIVSTVCTEAAALERELCTVVAELQTLGSRQGVRLCGAGTHPFGRELAVLTPLPRYLAMEAQAGFRLHDQTTFATHVHVGVQSGDEAIALMRGMKPYLPLLLALSANSPFWRGHDTGCASYRQRLLAATRSYGVPPTFSSWSEFCRFFDTTHRAGLFETINDIHWDLRPRPRFGTVEVRIMDQQATVADAVALGVLVRLLAIWLLRTDTAAETQTFLPRQLPWWVDKENHFQASRQGLAANFIGNAEGVVYPLRHVWEQLREALSPIAEERGEASWLDRIDARVVQGLGYARQRRLFERTGSLAEVTRLLAEELEAETAALRAAAGSPGAFERAGRIDRRLKRPSPR